MKYIDELPNEIKEIIFSYIPLNTLSQVSYNYFLTYAPIKYNNLFVNVKVENYFREVIKNDASFILIVALDNLPVGIFRKTIWYRKRKMKFWEYLNFISLYYDTQLCRQLIVEYM